MIKVSIPNRGYGRGELSHEKGICYHVSIPNRGYGSKKRPRRTRKTYVKTVSIPNRGYGRDCDPYRNYQQVFVIIVSIPNRGYGSYFFNGGLSCSLQKCFNS